MNYHNSVQRSVLFGLAGIVFVLFANVAFAQSQLNIFPPGTTPTQFYSNPSPVELGVKFRSDVNGLVTGIRFYKDPADTSVHTGSLWSTAGQLLATGTFIGETESGWQQLNFTEPVAISASTTYVASYNTSTGHYYNFNYFQNQGVDNGPLRALRDGVDGPNGVYQVSLGGLYPSSSDQATNFWVDVVFTPAAAPQITVVSGSPQSAAIGTSFVRGLKVQVADPTTGPLAGVQVTFTGPAVGPGATFNAGNSETATTDATGIATSVVPFANAIAGTYNVLATVPGLTPATFTLTNTNSASPTTTQPTISAISLPSADQGATNLTATISGTNLTDVSNVSFSGTGVTATVSSFTSTSLTVSITIAPNAPIGRRDLTVTLPEGTSATLYGAFTVNQTVNQPCGVVVSGTVTVTANATDNVGSVGIQLKLDGVNFGPESTTAPHALTWITATTSNGCHTLTAVARDGAGKQGAASLAVFVSN